MTNNNGILKTVTLTSSLLLVIGFLLYRIGWFDLPPMRSTDADKVSLALMDTTKSDKSKSAPLLLPSSKVIIIPKPDSSAQSKARKSPALKYGDSNRLRLSSSKSAIIVDQSLLDRVSRKDSTKAKLPPSKARRKNND